MSLKIDGAPDGLAISQVTVSGTAVQVAAARASRRRLLVIDTSGSLGNIFFGSDDTVTTATGAQLLLELNNPLDLETAAALWAIDSAGNTNNLTVVEFYDVEA